MNILLNKPFTPCLKTLGNYLEKVNISGWYTNFGPLHEDFTNRLEDYLGVENLLLVSNGTLALHVAYRALNIKKAICTPFSYVATAGSLKWEKIPTSFIDINPDSLNLCPSRVRTFLSNTADIDSVVATHVYGNPCEVENFEEISLNHNVKVIYDGAHAFGVKYLDKSLLSYGDATTLSFHATKVFHTIEGGAIIFKKKEVHDRARQLINFALDKTGTPKEAGINAKLNEYQAAVGLTLLDSIDDILEHRAKLFSTYESLLESCVSLQSWNPNTSLKNGSYFPILLENEDEKLRIKSFLQDSGIPSREYFSPSLNTIYNEDDHCAISESVASKVLCLPLHYYLTLEEVTRIAKTVKKARS